MNNKFEVGQWVFFEYELAQITDMEEGRVTGRTNGYTRLSSHDLSDRCFPLTLATKMATDSTDYWRKKMSAASGLNMPDIHRKLVELWVAICEADGEKQQKAAYDHLNTFGQGIIDATSPKYVDGVSVYR